MMDMKTIIAATAVAFLLVACGAPAPAAQNAQPAGEIVVKDAWARPTIGMSAGESHSNNEGMHHGGAAMGGVNSAVYMIIENKSAAADRLLGVTGDVAEMIEVHQTKEKDGMMMMEPMKDGLTIPANGSVELKPAGYHIMLMNVKQELKPGETFKLTLAFQSGKSLPVEVTVREP